MRSTIRGTGDQEIRQSGDQAFSSPLKLRRDEAGSQANLLYTLSLTKEGNRVVVVCSDNS